MQELSLFVSLFTVILMLIVGYFGVMCIIINDRSRFEVHWKWFVRFGRALTILAIAYVLFIFCVVL